MEFELSLKPNSIETKLLKFAIENEKSYGTNTIIHSIDSVKQTEIELLNRLNHTPLSPSKVQKRLRNLSKRIKNIGKIPQTSTDTSFLKTYCNKGSSKWDCTIQQNPTKSTPPKTYGCKPQTMYTIKDGKIVNLLDVTPGKQIFDINSKMSVEEIKQHPKFKNYKSGTPSKVMTYIFSHLQYLYFTAFYLYFKYCLS